MSFSLCDMHCDTLTELYSNKCGIVSNKLHISLDRAAQIKPYIQMCAVWSDNGLGDNDAYTRFFKVTDYFEAQSDKWSHKASLCRSADEVKSAVDSGKAALVYTVEDARLLAGDIGRLALLHRRGVRILTFMWNGETVIGGSFNTNSGLTDFGSTVLDKCFEIGMIPDVSHASVKSTDEILDRAAEVGGCAIATHSNSYECCSHPRNLSDSAFKKIMKLGGIVGISAAPQHLAEARQGSIDVMVRHILHYLDLGGENTVCLGCDFDGIDSTPKGLDGVDKLSLLDEALGKSGLDKPLREKIFFGNAYGFLQKNLK